MDNLAASATDSGGLIVWGKNYAIGIKQIDDQHKELVGLINELYRACLTNEETIGAAFKEAMKRMVDYVKFHFGDETKLLEKVGFPNLQEHRKQHDILIKQILEAAKEFNEGKQFVANNFVRTLRDWVMSHIAIFDKDYAQFIMHQKNKGLFPDIQLDV